MIRQVAHVEQDGRARRLVVHGIRVPLPTLQPGEPQALAVAINAAAQPDDPRPASRAERLVRELERIRRGIAAIDAHLTATPGDPDADQLAAQLSGLVTQAGAIETMLERMQEAAHG